MDDPIAFEVVKNGLAALADELAITIVRTAHSQVVRDSLDFSTAICDAEGRVVAQGCRIPLHLGAIPDAMQVLGAKFAGDVNPGDVFILNDPDEGGMHLPDIFVVRPVFMKERLIGYAACVAHYPEIGGRMPGGNSVDSTEIFQEGLQIPLLKLYERGRRDETLIAILLRNVRIPDVVMGDLDAQLAACHVGEAGLLDLAARYGADGLQDFMAQVLDYTEARLRAELRNMPDGEYSFVDHIDDDGFGSGPIPIAVTLRIAGDEIMADFSGTSPQVRSALNATMSFTKSTVYAALKCAVDDDIPTNSGFYRPITVTAPAGRWCRRRSRSCAPRGWPSSSRSRSSRSAPSRCCAASPRSRTPSSSSSGRPTPSSSAPSGIPASTTSATPPRCCCACGSSSTSTSTCGRRASTTTGSPTST